MKKSLRRILSLALSLALVCTLAVVGSAVYVADGESPSRIFDGLKIIAGVGIEEYSVEAYVNLAGTPASVLQSATIEADVGLVYTYCPESAMRPSNYMTATKNETLYKVNNRTTTWLAFSTGDLTYGIYGDCVVLEATGNFVIDYTTPNTSGEYAPNPIHVVNDTI